MSVKSIIFFVLAVIFFSTIFAGNGGGAVFVSIVLTALFGWLGYRSMKTKPNFLKTESKEPETVEVDKPAPASPYEYVSIKVAGVTFKNGRKSRQSILRAIRFRDGEFSDYVELELKPYEWEGKPAYGVYANDQQIGNIPADTVDFVSENYDRIDSICDIDVYGGGRDEDNNVISYGCKIILKLKKI